MSYGGSQNTRSNGAPGRRAPRQERGHVQRHAPRHRSARPRRVQVAWIAATGLGRPIHERGPRRAARERLDPHRPRAGVQVEHDRVVRRLGAEAGEQPLPRPVGDGPDAGGNRGRGGRPWRSRRSHAQPTPGPGPRSSRLRAEEPVDRALEPRPELLQQLGVRAPGAGRRRSARTPACGRAAPAPGPRRGAPA